MDTGTNGQKLLTDLFKKKPCWMIKPLSDEMNYSIPSVRRFLSAAGYYSSFTHNGKWYTLQTTPRFNRDGLWFHNEIGFSKTGSLTDTLIGLITNSQAGLTAEQVGDKLHSRCHSVLVGLYRQNKLQRQKAGRSYIYLAADTPIATRQRKAISLQDARMQQLPAEISVLVLAEYIRNPKADFAELAKTIKQKVKVSIKIAQIKMLFQQHGLKKKMLTGEQ